MKATEQYFDVALLRVRETRYNEGPKDRLNFVRDNDFSLYRGQFDSISYTFKITSATVGRKDIATFLK